MRDAAFAGLLRESDPGRTLLLIFSDGDDTSSWLTTPKVIETAKRTDAVVYAVVVPLQRAFWTPQGGATIDTVKKAGKFLESLTEETGGRVLFASSNSICARRSRSVANPTTYVLSYSPLASRHRVGHRLELRSKGKWGLTPGAAFDA